MQSKNSNKREAVIQNEVRARLNSSKLLRLFRNNVGQTPLPCPGCFISLCGKCEAKYRRPVKYGLSVGSADLIGFTNTGRFVAIELKTDKGKLRPEQVIWLKLVEEWGGIARVIRSVEEADALLEELQNESVR